MPPVLPENTKFTPHPLVDLVVQYYLLLYGNAFIVSGTLENPAPVSVNRLYSVFRGKEHLTTAGRAYRDGLSAVIARSTMEWKTAVEAVYQGGAGATLVVGLYFKSLHNASWKPGARTASGALQEPRKKQDSANYIKIVEDAVVRGNSIDDCNNIVHLIYKAEDPIRPRTEIIYIVA